MPPTAPPMPLIRRVGALAAAYASLGGVVTLLGWLLELPRLTDWGATGIAMKVNTAVCAGACGCALLVDGFAPARRRTIRALGLLVGGIAALTLTEHVTNVDLGLDNLLVQEPPGALATVAPGRMGLPASLAFTSLGTALFCLTRGPRARRWTARLGVLALCIAALPLIGYLYGASELFAFARVTGIAWQTATMIAALGVAMMIAVPEHGVVAALHRSDAGGLVLRRLVFPVVLFPVLIGWLRLRGEQSGLYDAAFGTAARTFTEMILLLGVLWWTARGISRYAEAARRAEKALRSSEERIALALSASLTIAWSWELGEGIVTHSDNARTILGLSTQQEIKAGMSRVHPDDVDVLRATIDRAMAQPGEHQVDFRYSRPQDGRELWLQSHAKVESDSSGRPLRVVGTTTDITERKQAELALREADLRKDEFLAMLAHELRNPLAPLRSGLDLARAGRSDAEELERVRAMMERQVAQLVHLVDDLLDVSRVSRGKIELRKEPIDLRTALDGAIEICRPVFQGHGHELVVIHAPRRVVVHGDLTRLSQVFANLLHNAAKYTERGGLIHVVVECVGEDVFIRVRDNGIGIAPEHLSSIFDMFMQIDKSLARSGGGLGVGLTLARRLIEMHDGSVVAHSPPEAIDASGRPANGSEFVVRLPMVRIETHELNVQQPSAWSLPRTRRRVLVADDNIDGAEVLSMLLEELGHEIRMARDGVDALEAATTFRPDIILLDIGMPKLDGYEVARRVRAEPWGQDMFLIAVTGWGRQDDRRRSADAGFDHHLVKPVSIERLTEVLALAELARRPAHPDAVGQ